MRGMGSEVLVWLVVAFGELGDCYRVVLGAFVGPGCNLGSACVLEI